MPALPPQRILPASRFSIPVADLQTTSRQFISFEHSLYQPFYHLRVQYIICIQKTNKLPLRLSKPRIPCAGRTSMGYINQSKVGSSASLCSLYVLLNNLLCFISRSVVYYYNIKILMRGIQNTLQTTSNPLFLLIGRYNNRY